RGGASSNTTRRYVVARGRRSATGAAVRRARENPRKGRTADRHGGGSRDDRLRFRQRRQWPVRGRQQGRRLYSTVRGTNRRDFPFRRGRLPEEATATEWP